MLLFIRTLQQVAIKLFMLVFATVCTSMSQKLTILANMPFSIIVSFGLWLTRNKASPISEGYWGALPKQRFLNLGHFYVKHLSTVSFRTTDPSVRKKLHFEKNATEMIKQIKSDFFEFLNDGKIFFKSTMLPRRPCPWGRSQPKLVADDLSAEEKKWIGTEISHFNVSPKLFLIRYGLKTNTTSKWARDVRDGVCIHGVRGRPRILGEENEKTICNLLTDNTYQVREGEFKKIFQDQVYLNHSMCWCMSWEA